ncbi:MAG: hypothetical protein Q9169_006174 [Polycauliona sp. 2 TL-2023]
MTLRMMVQPRYPDDSIWHHIPKSAPTLATSPPTMNDGALFSNGSSLWLYGGKVTSLPGPKPPIPPNAIWRYDLGSGTWSQSPSRGQPIQRLVDGTYLQTNTSQALYLGGFKARRSDASYNALRDSENYAVQGLLVFDQMDGTIRNDSTGWHEHSRNFVRWIRILVAFGGVTTEVGAAIPFTFDTGYRDADVHAPLQNISIYDIGTQNWYQQQATGDVPTWRYRGCAIAVTAPDMTSHSIYVFGGWGSTTTEANDGNVYVLSVPSFVWIRVTLDRDQRSHHQCHLMGNHHMLVVGGAKPDGQTKAATARGMLGCDTDPKFSQGLGIFSLNSHAWTTDYDPGAGAGATPYQIHPSISKVIGGNATGGATKNTPDIGFSSKALLYLMMNASLTNTTGARPSGNPEKPRSSRNLSRGAVAGTAAGVTFSALLMLAIVLYLVYRHRRFLQKKSTSAHPTTQVHPPTEICAGPVGQELRGGAIEDSLASMFRSQEVTNIHGIHEMPAAGSSHELPALPEHPVARVLSPDGGYPAPTNKKDEKRQRKR